MRSRVPISVVCAVPLLLAACVEGARPISDGGVVGFDGMPFDTSRPDTGMMCPRSGDVDLLFMIDNSSSMREEQVSLGMQLPRFVQTLTSGDLNADGVLEFQPVQSLQVGVVTSDMGTGGAAVPTCGAPDAGDDGILRTDGSASGCGVSSPRFLSFRSGDDAADFATRVGCLTNQGTAGCAFEQQLEATLKAVTPSSSAVRFAAGSRRGHADGQNAGLVRPGALLVVVVVTDEEDCSASDPEIFDPGSRTYSGPLTLRCFDHAGDPPLFPVDRYVDGLLAAKGDPGALVYAAITGVPRDLVDEGADYDTILADPDMQEMIDPAMPTQLRPSCNVPGRGLAFPPRRIVEVGRRLDQRGVNTTMQSICQADFSPAVDAILMRIGEQLRHEFCE